MARRNPRPLPRPATPRYCDASDLAELREGRYFIQPGHDPHTRGPIYGQVLRWSWDDNLIVFDTIYNRDLNGTGPDRHLDELDFDRFFGIRMQEWYDHDQLPPPLTPKRRGLDIQPPAREGRGCPGCDARSPPRALRWRSAAGGATARA